MELAVSIVKDALLPVAPELIAELPAELLRDGEVVGVGVVHYIEEGLLRLRRLGEDRRVEIRIGKAPVRLRVNRVHIVPVKGSPYPEQRGELRDKIPGRPLEDRRVIAGALHYLRKAVILEAVEPGPRHPGAERVRCRAERRVEALVGPLAVRDRGKRLEASLTERLEVRCHEAVGVLGRPALEEQEHDIVRGARKLPAPGLIAAERLPFAERLVEPLQIRSLHEAVDRGERAVHGIDRELLASEHPGGARALRHGAEATEEHKGNGKEKD